MSEREREAVRLLLRLMEDTFVNWRTTDVSKLTIPEQEAREFLLSKREPSGE